MHRRRYWGLAAIYVSLAVLFSSVQAKSQTRAHNQQGVARANDLKSLIETLQISISIETLKRKRGSNIRSLMLYVSPHLRIEPAAIGPDGKPLEAHAKVSIQEAKALIDVLVAQGFLERATKFHSNRTPIDKKLSPPPDSREYSPSPDPSGEIKLTIFDEHWYTIYEGELPSGDDGALILKACERTLSGKAYEYMQQLTQAKQ